MAGTKVHTKFPARTHNHSPVSNARKVLRSRDPGLSRESVIHAFRTLWRHRELDFNNEDDVKLLTRKLGINESFTLGDARALITLGNAQR